MLLDLVHFLEVGRDGKLQRPVPGGRNERKLGVRLLVVVGDVVEPQPVAVAVQELLLALLDGEVLEHAPGGLELQEVGMLAEDEERVAHERPDLVLDLGNVVQASRGHGGLARP
jgi:hypothetical protein